MLHSIATDYLDPSGCSMLAVANSQALPSYVCTFCLQDNPDANKDAVHFWCLDNDAASIAFAQHR